MEQSSEKDRPLFYWISKNVPIHKQTYLLYMYIETIFFSILRDLLWDLEFSNPQNDIKNVANYAWRRFILASTLLVYTGTFNDFCFSVHNSKTELYEGDYLRANKTYIQEAVAIYLPVPSTAALEL